VRIVALILLLLSGCEPDATLGISTPCDQRPCLDNLDPVAK
jgi:hypothetical protein